MKIFRLIIIILGFVCVIYACISDSSKYQQQGDYGYYIDHEICISNLIPLNVPIGTNLDSILVNSKHKLIIYVDSSNCEDCRISMALTIRGYELELKRKQKEIPFIYIFNTQDIFGLKEHLDSYGFRHYYFVDVEDRFLLDNGIQRDKRFHTFLLENNKIKAIGNPSNSSSARKRYNEVLKIH